MATTISKERVGLYARISLDKAGDAAGVERQMKECRALAKSRGLSVVEIFTDNDRSAYSGRRRPEWERMLDALRDGSITTVVAWANDRLYRRVRDQLDLLEAVSNAGGRIVTLRDGEVDPTSAEGRMRATILSSVAEFESARKAERVAAAAEDRAAKGRPHGRPSYGWTSATTATGEPIAGQWVLAEDQAAILREVANRILGGESVTTISKSLNDRDIPTPAGGREWWPMSLRKLMRRPAMAGLRDHRGEVVGPGDWPAILDRETWEAVVRALRSPAPQRKPRKYLLSGILRCAIDGERMTGHVTRARSYRCVGCGQRIHADRLDELVTDTVLDALDTPALAKRIAAAKDDPQEGGALRDLAAADERLASLAQLYGSGEIALEEYRVAQRAAADARTEAERKLTDRRGTRTLSQAIGATGGIRRVWEDAPMGWRRQLLDAVLERIEIGPVAGSGWQPARASLIWRHE